MSQTLNGNGNGNGQQTVVLSPPPAKAVSKPLDPGFRETRVVFRLAKDILRHGNLVRVTPHIAFFEVHDSTLILRLSEVLEDFQVIMQGRVVYTGRAVVSSVVETGFKTACEVNLRETGWAGMDVQAALRQNGDLANQFNAFVDEWQKLCKVRAGFKTAAIDLMTFFNEAHVWLNQVELGIRTLPAPDQARAEQAVLEKLSPMFISATTNITERFEHELNLAERELLPWHQSFLRQLMHPVTQCSPFMHRAFEKPLGYAGDFEVVDMMFRNPFQGVSYFAKLLNAYALQLPPVTAHRNRIEYLQKKLGDESLRVLTQGRGLTVFNLGCGPAREVQQFMEHSELSHRTRFVLADFEERTLTHTNQVLHEIKSRRQRQSKIKTVKISVAQLIKEHERRGKQTGREQYDFIYCAGLFDYLTDAVCQHLMNAFYSMLAPDGLLVATNVDRHEAINQMECFLDWHLVYRDTKRMREITPEGANPDDVTIKRDASGANVFIEIRKRA